MTKLWTSAVVAAAAGWANAQCYQPVWSNEFATPALGLSATAATLQVFDADGMGPGAAALFVGGEFQTAGGLPIARVARRSGGQWSSVGTFNGTMVSGLGVHDFDGPGPGGQELVAIGNFTTINGVPIQNAARWTGSQWSAIGGWLPYPYVGYGTSSIVSWDHDANPGTPARLVVSGQFEVAEFEYASILMWDGAQWTVIPGDALSLAVFDEDGAGPQAEKLFAALDWDPGLRKWDGQSWEIVGGGLRSAVHTCVALRVIDEDGPGPGRGELFVGGYFSEAGTAAISGIAKWNGQAWSPVGSGIAAQVEDILAVDYTGGTGAPTIYATGWGSGGAYVWKHQLNEPDWKVVGQTSAQFGLHLLYRLAAFDESGTGRPSVYHVAFSLFQANGQASRNIARLMCTCRANCDGSNVAPYLTANDFQCFINSYAAGCS